MYTLIGADQKEYGPADASQVRLWIAEGRADARTLARLDAGPWKPLSTFPEFADLPGMTSAGAPAASSPPPPSTPGPIGVPVPADPRRMVQAPAACLVALGAIGGLLYLGSAGVHLMGGAHFTPPEPIGNAEVERIIEFMSGAGGVIFDALGLLISAAILVGGLMMFKLRAYGLCVAAAVLALVPCVSPCCCLGLPLGIWALVVLFKPEVKSAFR
jgi:hypothetical protein